MKEVYSDGNALLHDYHRLGLENRNKAGNYIKGLLRLQTAETDLADQRHELEPEKESGDYLNGGVTCSFCGKKPYEVFRMVAGPRGAYICNECAKICSEILDEEAKSETEQ